MKIPTLDEKTFQVTDVAIFRQLTGFILSCKQSRMVQFYK